MRSRFTRTELELLAANIWRRMSLARAGCMIGVSPGQVARWRDGAELTDDMARRVAISIVASRLDMVGVFGRVDTRGARLRAEMDSRDVVVRVDNHNEEDAS